MDAISFASQRIYRMETPVNVQTVTILVQTVSICALAASTILGWSKALYWQSNYGVAEKGIDRMLQEARIAAALNADLNDANVRLKEQLSQIPLAEKPPKVDNSVQRARTSGDVRRLTEQSWGKPDERN